MIVQMISIKYTDDINETDLKEAVIKITQEPELAEGMVRSETLIDRKDKSLIALLYFKDHESMILSLHRAMKNPAVEAFFQHVDASKQTFSEYELFNTQEFS